MPWQIYSLGFTWCPKKHDFARDVTTSLKCGFESDCHAYSADSNEIVSAGVAQSFEGVHFRIDAYDAPAWALGVFCSPRSLEA